MNDTEGKTLTNIQKEGVRKVTISVIVFHIETLFVMINGPKPRWLPTKKLKSRMN